MKLRKSLALVLVLSLLAAIAGCGSSTSAAKAEYNIEAPAMAASGMYEESAMDSSALYAGSTSGSNGSADANNLPSNRKFVITVYMSAETDDMDSLLAGITAKLAGLGGYVESQSIENGSTRSGTRRYRNANMTLRIPAEQLSQLTEEIGQLSNVVSSSRNTEDVTLNYVDTQSRVKSLEVERDRLLELMEQAENMTDLLEIESRLTEVRYRLEQYASQLRVLDNQIDYATVSLYISEVKEYTPVAERTRWQKICDGFMESLSDLGDGILDFFAWILINIPYLVVWAVVIVLIVFGSKKLYKRSQEKKRKKIAAHYEAMQKQQSQQKNEQ